MRKGLTRFAAMMTIIMLLTSALPTLTLSSAESDVSFSGSFAKSKYTMAVGETLDVKVKASVTNATLTRVTINVDKSDNNRLASKEVNTSDWSGYLTLDASVAPLNVPGTYTIKLFAGFGTGAGEWAEVDRATLVVTEPQISIDGSFGKSNYTMEVGETLGVKVSASAENASLTRVTINVDSSSDDRLVSKEVSGSSWKGTLYLDGTVYPLNVPGTYTIKLFAAVGDGADEWAEVDQATLVVTEATSEFTISGSFGKDKYTMAVGETLAVAVKASATNASLTRVTINVDSSGNDRLTSKEVSGSNWSGSLTLDASVAPLNVPGTYTIKLFAAIGDGSDEWAEVDQATLVVNEAEPEVTISGSFGKSKYVMDVGEKLDVAVTASATNASLTRVTINVDSSGNDRLTSKEVSGSNWSGSLTLDASVTPLNVPGTYTIKLFAAIGDGADEWAEVDQATLVVMKAGNEFISGSFGKDSYTMKVGEKLDVAVTASATNASLTRVTINVDSSGNDRLTSKEVSGSNWSGSLTLDASVAPLNVPGTYTIKLFAAIGDGADEWAEVDQATLVVMKAGNEFISGSFGKDSYTMKVGEKLDVAVTASATNASLTRVTINVDSSGNDRLTSKEVSGSNWSGSLTLDASVAPLNVPGTYTIKLFAAIGDGSDEWAEVDQATLVVMKAGNEFISGSFGKDSYTMKVGEKLDVAVTASATNASLTRVTINVDSSGNDRLTSKEVSGSNWSGSLTLDASVAPLNVPGTYTIKLFAAIGDGSDEWAEVDQATLVVMKAGNEFISGSFGKDSYTMKVGEKLDVAVTASATNASLTRVTINVDSSGNDRLTSKEVSGSNWSGSLTLDASVAPLNVPGTYTIKLFAAIGDGADEWAEVDQATLVVMKAGNEFISGSFGKDSYTMKVGEKLDVAVTASATNASLTRVTINVDSSGNDRLTSKEVSGSNWSGSLTLDASVAPLNVPGTYTIKLFAAIGDGADEWAEVDQATLVVMKAGNEFISGSFGKDSYTMKVGEKLDVAVTASATNASLTRVTINVDSSGNDRLTSKEVSGSNWSGSLTLDASVAPLNVPGTYTIKLFAAIGDGADEWAEVDQATLVVTKLPDPVLTVAVDGAKMIASWEDVPGAVRYVFSLRKTSEPNGDPPYNHVETDGCSITLDLEPGVEYRLAVAAVPAGVEDTKADTKKCSWGLATFTTETLEEINTPKVLKVETDMKANFLLPGEEVTIKVTCNKATKYLDVYDPAYRTLKDPEFNKEGYPYFEYIVSYAATGKVELRFIALDEQLEWSRKKEHQGFLDIIVCDHTTTPKLISTSNATKKDRNVHTVTETYEDACLCGKVSNTWSKEVDKPHTWGALQTSKTHTQGKGHRRFYECTACHQVKDADYISFLVGEDNAKKCSTCWARYELISELQKLLSERGYSVGDFGFDGIFGNDTKNAMNAFRKDVMKLGPIDDVDEATMAALRNGISPITSTSIRWSMSRLDRTVNIKVEATSGRLVKGEYYLLVSNDGGNTYVRNRLFLVSGGETSVEHTFDIYRDLKLTDGQSYHVATAPLGWKGDYAFPIGTIDLRDKTGFITSPSDGEPIAFFNTGALTVLWKEQSGCSEYVVELLEDGKQIFSRPTDDTYMLIKLSDIKSYTKEDWYVNHEIQINVTSID